MNRITLPNLVTAGWLCFFDSARAEDVKISGEASCAKCALNLTAECQNAITVTGKDGKKEVILMEQNTLAKDFHSVICQDPAKVKAEGVLAEQNGQKVITLTKIEVEK
jgi:hypothetical protein